MNVQAVAVPKTIQLPVWIVYQKENSNWIQKAAFIGKAACDTWASHNLGGVPARDMHGWGAQVYAARLPVAFVQVASDGQSFSVDNNGTRLEVIDLNELPDALPMVEHLVGLLGEYRSFRDKAREDKERWSQFRALMRCLSEDDLLLAPRSHI